MPHFCPHPLQKRVNVRRYVLLPGVLIPFAVGDAFCSGRRVCVLRALSVLGLIFLLLLAAQVCSQFLPNSLKLGDRERSVSSDSLWLQTAKCAISTIG